MKIYTENDFVKVVDAAGNEQPAVPKTWLDKSNGLLPEGTKKASTRSSSSDNGSGSGS